MQRCSGALMWCCALMCRCVDTRIALGSGLARTEARLWHAAGPHSSTRVFSSTEASSSMCMGCKAG
jgi:hypothetical protein